MLGRPFTTFAEARLINELKPKPSDHMLRVDFIWRKRKFCTKPIDKLEEADNKELFLDFLHQMQKVIRPIATSIVIASYFRGLLVLIMLGAIILIVISTIRDFEGSFIISIVMSIFLVLLSCMEMRIRKVYFLENLTKGRATLQKIIEMNGRKDGKYNWRLSPADFDWVELELEYKRPDIYENIASPRLHQEMTPFKQKFGLMESEDVLSPMSMMQPLDNEGYMMDEDVAGKNPTNFSSISSRGKLIPSHRRNRNTYEYVDSGASNTGLSINKGESNMPLGSGEKSMNESRLNTFKYMDQDKPKKSTDSEAQNDLQEQKNNDNNSDDDDNNKSSNRKRRFSQASKASSIKLEQIYPHEIDSLEMSRSVSQSAPKNNDLESP